MPPSKRHSDTQSVPDIPDIDRITPCYNDIQNPADSWRIHFFPQPSSFLCYNIRNSKERIDNLREDDASLIRSILSGDQNQYRVLVNRYQTAATRWALHYVKDSNRAEEIVQEAFVEAYFRLNKLREPEKFGSWLRSFVNYAAIAWLRRRKSTLWIEDVNIYQTGGQQSHQHKISTPYDDLEKQEREDLLQVAIRAILPEHQKVIQMFYFEGYSQQQIADQMNRSVSAIKSMLHRARQQLRKEMSRYE